MPEAGSLGAGASPVADAHSLIAIVAVPTSGLISIFVKVMVSACDVMSTTPLCGANTNTPGVAPGVAMQ